MTHITVVLLYAPDELPNFASLANSRLAVSPLQPAKDRRRFAKIVRTLQYRICFDLSYDSYGRSGLCFHRRSSSTPRLTYEQAKMVDRDGVLVAQAA